MPVVDCTVLEEIPETWRVSQLGVSQLSHGLNWLNQLEFGDLN
jgi:hypothetical protein